MLKEITIQPHFLLVEGLLLDLGKVWSGSLLDRDITLLFIGGGKAEIHRNDGGDGGDDIKSIWLKPHYFDQLKAYLMVNLKPIEIV